MNDTATFELEATTEPESGAAVRSSDWLAVLFAKQPDKMIMRTIEITESRVRKLVPHGGYCYDGKGVCPFWSRFDGIYPSQSNGYCSLMERGDWMAVESGGTSLIWDQCKECGINDHDEDSANSVNSSPGNDEVNA